MEIETYNEDGVLISREESENIVDVTPSATELFSQLPALQAEAVLTLAIGLVMGAGDLWDASSLVPESNPTKQFVDIITTVALEAALPLISP